MTMQDQEPEDKRTPTDTPAIEDTPGTDAETVPGPDGKPQLRVVPLPGAEAKQAGVAVDKDHAGMQILFIPDVGIRSDPEKKYIRPSCPHCGHEVSRYCSTGQLPVFEGFVQIGLQRALIHLEPQGQILIAPVVCPRCHWHEMEWSPIVKAGPDNVPPPRPGRRNG